jgi:hypothetical protein
MLLHEFHLFQVFRLALRLVGLPLPFRTKPGDFRKRHVAGPASAMTPNTEPRRCGNRDDEDQQQRYGDARL